MDKELEERLERFGKSPAWSSSFGLSVLSPSGGSNGDVSTKSRTFLKIATVKRFVGIVGRISGSLGHGGKR